MKRWLHPWLAGAATRILDTGSSRDLYGAMGRSVASRYAVYLAHLVSTLVLARLFTPEQFGVLAAFAIVATFLDLFLEAGFGPAIINSDALPPRERNGIFSFTILLGVAIAGVILLIRHPLESFYGIQGVAAVAPWAAAGAVFMGASTLLTGSALRDRRFGDVAMAGLMAELVATGSAVVLLSVINPIGALASRLAISRAVTFVVLYAQSHRTEIGRPLPGTRLGAVSLLARFSAFQLAFNFVNFFSRNADNLLVGRHFGAGPLGVYDKAYTLMMYPLMLLTFAMNPAIQPTLRHYVDDPAAAEQIHAKLVRRLALLGVAAGIAVAALARPLVSLVLGEQWTEVVPLIAILALSIPLQVVASTAGSFFRSMNRPDLLFFIGLAGAVIIVGSIVIGVLLGSLESVAWAFVIACHLNILQVYGVLYRYVFRRPALTFARQMLLPIALHVLFVGAWLVLKSEE